MPELKPTPRPQATKAVKGMPDILPGVSERWQALEQAIRQVAAGSGYREIRTALMERTELFERGVGDGTDIVSKEMFTFSKSADAESAKRLTLRPEGTAGVVRAFIEHGLSRQPKPLRLYYTGPMFRYERPQAGRQRQFHQAGFELFGVDSPSADAELVILAKNVLDALGVTPDLYTLHVNNVGDAATRERFSGIIREALAPHAETLCEDCQLRLQKNALRVLDCKHPNCAALHTRLALPEQLQTSLNGKPAAEQYEATLALLSALKIPFERNPRLVRGLDYYTRFVFEFTVSPSAATKLGAQSTFCGGGRYNNLVSALGGPETPAVGLAFGLERLLLLMPDGCESKFAQDTAFVASVQPENALKLAQALRKQTPGRSVLVALEPKTIGKWLDQANKQGAVSAYLQGQDEAEQGDWLLKNLTTGQQTTLPQTELFN
ncbi:MAG: histidine--tRNA ligase [Vampirovibrionales bacterium]|nr:histidine--tRNA ligase [Vampirovibrionales bacterium]